MAFLSLVQSLMRGSIQSPEMPGYGSAEILAAQERRKRRMGRQTTRSSLNITGGLFGPASVGNGKMLGL